MTADRPTGPATAAETWERLKSAIYGYITSSSLDFSEVEAAMVARDEYHRAAERARILAALPEALAMIPSNFTDLDVAGQRLAAAIEAQLSREPGEEG